MVCLWETTWDSSLWKTGRKWDNTSPCLRLPILGDICKDWKSFCFVSSSSHFWSIKEPGTRPWQDGYLRHEPSVFSVSCLPSYSLFLASTPLLSESLACCAMSRVCLDSVTEWAGAWSGILIPCPGTEPGQPGWKPGILDTRSARARS